MPRARGASSGDCLCAAPRGGGWQEGRDEIGNGEVGRMEVLKSSAIQLRECQISEDTSTADNSKEVYRV
jgi:hypothetical protein